MTRVDVNLGERSYSIEIGKGNLYKTDFRQFGTGRYAIITDSNVMGLYGLELEKFLKEEQGLDVDMIPFPAGEESKSWEMAGEIGRKLARGDHNRKSTVIALGGGVTGDLAGFTSSCFYRGIGFVQVPTTLLAMVDSSVGGKTAVDIPEGKNLMGHFYQPLGVIADTDTLRTLPTREIRNGLAEVIKYGMILDKELFRYLEEYHPDMGDDFFPHIVKQCCRIKARVVEQDEKESEKRKILNYGHTLGHSYEASSGYEMRHGEAVGLGMAGEGWIAWRMGLLGKDDLERQNRLIEASGLPTSYPGDPGELLEYMRRDKKNRGGEIYFVLPTSIGTVLEEGGRISFPVEESLIMECVAEMAKNAI